MTDEKIVVAEERRVPCEVYSRVVGYLRPVGNWNTGKQQEFKDRVVFTQMRTEKEFKGKNDNSV